MDKKSKSNKSIKTFLNEYLFPTVSVIVLILVLILVTFPTITKIQNSAGVIETRNKRIAELENFLSDLKDLSDHESEFVSDNLVLDRYLPKDSRVSSLIDEINLLAESAGLEATELVGQEKVKPEESVGDYEEVESPKRVLITFNYVGVFDEVYKLFEEINGFKGLLSVESINFSRRADNWDVEITVASYNLPDTVLEQIVNRIIEMEGAQRIESVNDEVLKLVKERVGA